MKPAPEGAGNSFRSYSPPTQCGGRRLTRTLRARVQDGDGAAILRPAGDVVADRDRAFLAVGDRAHAARIDTVRRHIGLDRLGAAGAERDVVFAGAAFVRVTFDR